MDVQWWEGVFEIGQTQPLKGSRNERGASAAGSLTHQCLGRMRPDSNILLDIFVNQIRDDHPSYQINFRKIRPVLNDFFCERRIDSL